MGGKAHRGIRYLVVVAVVLGACGGGSDQAGGTTQATSAPTEAPPTVPANGPSLGDECQRLADFMLGIAEIFAGDSSAIEQLFATVSPNLPGELADEVETIRSAILQWDAALGEMAVDLSDAEAVATLTPKQLEQVDQAYSSLQLGTNDAMDAIGAYGEAECAEFVPSG